MSAQITSPFTVDKFEPLASSELDGTSIGHIRITKTFTGDLVGTSTVEMLSAGTPAGPARYVAFERVTGSLKGKTGSFIFQHVGDATVTPFELELLIVKGSGTGELAGIGGRGTIIIENKQHRLELEYELA